MRPALLIAAMFVSSTAFAANFKKMTVDQIVTVLQTDKSSKNREKAADWIGDNRLLDAGPALRGACNPSELKSVCDHALWALEKFHTPDAHALIEEVLLDTSFNQDAREVAMRVLKREDRARLAQAAPAVLLQYRSLDQGFTAGLLDALVEGGNANAKDLAVLIAADVGAGRKARVAGIEAARAFQHPLLFQACVTMLGDTDKKVRLECVQELAKPGLPADQVVPALMKTAELDEAGDVRAAAWKALRGYVSPDLLPLLNRRVLVERHLGALFHVLDLFSLLADASSTAQMQSLLPMDTLATEYRQRLVRAAVRIGDPSFLPVLQAMLTQELDAVLRAEVEQAILLLQGPPAARVVYVQQLAVPEVIWIDATVPVAPLPVLSVSVDASGSVQMSADLAGTLGISVQATGL